MNRQGGIAGLRGAGTRRLRGICAVLAFLCALFAATASAQIQLAFDPPSVTVAPGASTFVAITVDGAPTPGLAALQVVLDYDPLIAHVFNPNEAFRGTVPPFVPLGTDPLCTTVRGTPTCEDPDWLLIATGRTSVAAPDTVDNGAGRVEFVHGSYGVTAPPMTAGSIGYIEVSGVALGNTVISLDSSILANNAEPPTALAYAPASLAVEVSDASPDSDGDGVPDNLDNCTLIANADQRDTNGDGYGNICDYDLNNDGFTNFGDLAQFKSVFLQADADADFNGDGFVNFGDLALIKSGFLMPPGPSGLAP